MVWIRYALRGVRCRILGHDVRVATTFRFAYCIRCGEEWGTRS